MRITIAGALAGVVVAMATPTSGQSILEIAAGLKFCKTLKDDTQRLSCFDQLVSERPDSKPAVSADPPAWTVTENKSPVDDSPQVEAVMTAPGNEVALALRCREKHTDAIFGTRSFLGSRTPIKVLVRIGDAKPIETNWQPSEDGRAVFAPAPVAFMKALPDNTKLFIRATGYGGKILDGEFNTSDVSAIRERISKACNWPTPKR
jgi:hypothetical protein